MSQKLHFTGSLKSTNLGVSALSLRVSLQQE